MLVPRNKLRETSGGTVRHPTNKIDAVERAAHSPATEDLAPSSVDRVTNSTLGQTILIFSRDPSLLKLAQRVARNGWNLERCDDIRNSRDRLARPQVGLVIVDDEGIEDHLRGWLLARVRSYAPQAPLVYVAGDHTDSCEKRARAYAAAYYTSKPVEPQPLLRVLDSFVSRMTR